MGVVTKIGAVVHRRRFVALAKYTHATGRRGKSPPFPGRSVVHRTWRCGNICGILCVGIPTIGLPNSLWLLGLALLAGASRCQRCIFPVGLRRPVSRLLLPFGFVATKKPSAICCVVRKTVACRVAAEGTWRACRKPSAWHQRRFSILVLVECFWGLCTNNGSWVDYLFKLVGKAQNSGLSDDPYLFWLGLLAVGARRCLAWAWRF